MSFIMVDIEADGPIPGDYSMIQLGAVLVTPQLDQTFYGQLKPISDNWIPEALAVSGATREETLKYPHPAETMVKFAEWVHKVGGNRPMFIADNNGFDWMFTHWYFIHFMSKDPFGFSSTNLGSLYKGIVRDMKPNFKWLRKTKHTHNPVDDAMGNAEALLEIKRRYNLNIRLT